MAKSSSPPLPLSPRSSPSLPPSLSPEVWSQLILKSETRYFAKGTIIADSRERARGLMVITSGQVPGHPPKRPICCNPSHDSESTQWHTPSHGSEF